MAKQSIIDLMNELLLPLLEPTTAEFDAFNHAVNSYILGDKYQIVRHLNCLASSSNPEIVRGSKAVIERAMLENF